MIFKSKSRFQHASLVRLLCHAMLLALVLTGCQSGPAPETLKRYQYQSAGMGTLFTMTLYAPEESQARAAAEAAFDRISKLEDTLSDYQADSELNTLREKPVGQPTKVSSDLFIVLERAQELGRKSVGAFDVTAGPYVRLWRFARKRKKLPSQAELETAAQAVGWRKMRLDASAQTVTLLAPKMQLDAGGIAKGFAADEALRVLRGRGVARALVAASGDIAVGAPPPGKRGWRIGVSPIDAKTNAVFRYVVLAHAGISTSGDTEQFIEIDGVRYSHIVNPATGLGLTNRIQATVIAPNATTSDALATAVCVLGPVKGLPIVESVPGTSALAYVKTENGIRKFQSQRFP